MNKIMLVGKIKEIKRGVNDNTYIKLNVSDSDYEDWNIKLSNKFATSVCENCDVGTIIGITGTPINENGNMVVKSEKVSFLTNNKDILNENER